MFIQMHIAERALLLLLLASVVPWGWITVISSSSLNKSDTFAGFSQRSLGTRSVGLLLQVNTEQVLGGQWTGVRNDFINSIPVAI